MSPVRFAAVHLLLALLAEYTNTTPVQILGGMGAVSSHPLNDGFARRSEGLGVGRRFAGGSVARLAVLGSRGGRDRASGRIETERELGRACEDPAVTTKTLAGWGSRG